MKEKSLLIKFLGDTPFARMIDFLVENKGFDFSKKEIAEGAGISGTSLFKYWNKLEKYSIVKKTRTYGKTKLYTLNSESEPVKKLLALELELIRKEMEEKVEVKV